MVAWKLYFTKYALKDAKKFEQSGLKANAEKILDILRENPYQTPPNFEKLVGDLKGAFSRRINLQYRIIYQIIDDKKVVKIIRMWAHYD